MSDNKEQDRKDYYKEHKFRYLLPPGNNFQFVAKFKAWLVMSFVLMAIAIGALFLNKHVLSSRGDYMNWTIDFKGGTEIVFAFLDRQANAGKPSDAPQTYTKVDPGTIRQALEKNGEHGVDVSEIEYEDSKGVKVPGIVVKTPRYSALADETKEEARKAFETHFKDKKIEGRANWSGDRLNVRTAEPLFDVETVDGQQRVNIKKVIDFFAGLNLKSAPTPDGKQQTVQKLEVKPWSIDEQTQYTTRDQGTKLYNQWFGIWGIDRQYAQIFENTLDKTKTQVLVVQSYGVGAKAGSKLRDDAAKAIVFAIFLIMLYLAFRFDIRYAPGAAFATIHDAVMVIGVFAITYTEVSLTTVAGLLTVMGFSVNDTVIVFDRIRENQAKLKDKSIERIIDISINEMLTRTILTSSTVFATTLIMNIFGTGLVQNFAFAMNVGVIVGTYSSIFLATPIFMYITKKWYSGPAAARRRPPPEPAKASKAEPEPAEE
jgi:preprotein translocase subunit SecF